jgi:hypothetical protein
VPVVRLYRHGLTAGTPPGANSHGRGKRGECLGWSASSIRTNTNFLFGVDETQLHGVGCALTLTVGECPETSDQWHGMRRAFERSLRRMGLIRMHWLTEWQRRGVPHMHQAIWLPGPADPWDGPRYFGRIFDHWLRIAEPFGAKLAGQHFAFIGDAVGWFKYVSKHGARGLHHYQRAPASRPRGWRRTGRMWGRVGHWMHREAMRLELCSEAFWRFRRVVRSARIADARAQGNGRRIVSARRMLSCSEKHLSAVRGVREWAELDESLRVLAWIHEQGLRVEQ